MTDRHSKTAFTYAWAQTTGAAHNVRGVPCEDTMGLSTIKDRDGTSWLIAAVADGAGSAQCAAEGSKLAAESFIEAAAETIIRHGTEDLALLMRSSAAYARAILEFVAEDAGRPLDDYHTTLLACVTCGNRSAFFQIGDGVILALDIETANWSAVIRPQNDDDRQYTFFLTLPKALDIAEIAIVERPISHVALTSDGLQDIILHPETLAIRSQLLDRLVGALAEVPASGDAEAVSSGLHAVLDSTAFRNFTADDASLLTVKLTTPPV
jgi:hypothetical protein